MKNLNKLALATVIASIGAGFASNANADWTVLNGALASYKIEISLTPPVVVAPIPGTPTAAGVILTTRSLDANSGDCQAYFNKYVAAYPAIGFFHAVCFDQFQAISEIGSTVK